MFLVLEFVTLACLGAAFTFLLTPLGGVIGAFIVGMIFGTYVDKRPGFRALGIPVTSYLLGVSVGGIPYLWLSGRLYAMTIGLSFLFFWVGYILCLWVARWTRDKYYGA